MTTLHMEVQVARDVQQRLMATHEACLEQLHQAINAVNQLQSGAWQGQSAQQFYSQFQSWQQDCSRVLQTLHELAIKLAREISEWEAAAQSL